MVVVVRGAHLIPALLAKESIAEAVVGVRVARQQPDLLAQGGLGLCVFLEL